MDAGRRPVVLEVLVVEANELEFQGDVLKRMSADMKAPSIFFGGLAASGTCDDEAMIARGRLRASRSSCL
jgi:hypothetical protein